MTAREIMAALAAPFEPDAISWRVGSTNADKSKGLALAYVDARDVAARLDAVMGADWQCRYVSMSNGTCCCEIGLKIDGEWRWRSNGAGATDVEGEKGQYSDAFKRSAVMWGIASYLYRLKSPWVALEAKGRSHVIAEHEHQRLRSILGGVGSQPVSRSERQPSAAAAHSPAPKLTATAEAKAESQAPLERVPDVGRRAQGLLDRLRQVSDLKALEHWQTQAKAEWGKLTGPEIKLVTKEWANAKVRVGAKDAA